MVVIALLLNVLFAFNLILIKSILAHTQPIFFQGARLFIAGMLLLGGVYYFDRRNFRLDKSHRGLFLQVSLFLMYINYVLSVLALDDLSSARYSFAINISPFFAAFFSYLYLSEKLTKKKWLGLMIGLVGFIPLLLAGKTGSNSSLFSLSGLQVLISLTAYTYGCILMRRLVKKEYYSPFMVNGIAMTLAGIAALFTSFFIEGWSSAPVFNVLPFMGYLLSIVLIGDLIAYGIYGLLLRKYTATFLSFAGVLYPLFCALLGWIFFSEIVTLNFFLSFCIVFIGLYIFYLEEHSEAYYNNNEKLND